MSPSRYSGTEGAFDVAPDTMPVYGTIASQYNDLGVDAAYLALMAAVDERRGRTHTSKIPDPGVRCSPPQRRIIPPGRLRYLGDISDAVRSYHRRVNAQADSADALQAVDTTASILGESAADALGRPETLWPAPSILRRRLPLEEWDAMQDAYGGDTFTYSVRGKDIEQPLTDASLSGLPIPRIALPKHRAHGDRVRWLMRENLPGRFPYTAGTFPLKRRSEEPKRMFAGEGGPAKTNARFHFLCKGEPVHRLSTAFDSVTLYGQDPNERPDIYGKIGESGVSIATLDDMGVLYQGFDLCAPTTSVSMTINGPAPILLAMFLNTAIDQQLAKFEAENGRSPDDAEAATVRQAALSTVRGTVQADILKEDQAQNTCIFSLEFALKMMGDIQSWFIENQVKNYYSVSVSGYHIAEAGANPISPSLAFTLSNGFTLVEYYRSRGMDIDAFAPNLSFFFSNGMDPEYTVIGRVARRIWAIAMDRLYGGNSRSQKLKYHIQTSGRSLHAREIQFNDIRTTLQALLAIQDQCNSLHTNAYDEAITTPTEESVRRAMAIQKIVNQEFGVMKNENNMQGSFFVETLTDMVEQAVLEEFERIDQRGESSVPWRRNTSAARSSQRASTTSTRNTLGRSPWSASTPSSIRRQPLTTGNRQPSNCAAQPMLRRTTRLRVSVPSRAETRPSSRSAGSSASCCHRRRQRVRRADEYRTGSKLGTDHRSTVRGRWRISPESVGAGDTLRLADLCEGHREPREKMGHSPSPKCWTR